MAELAWSGRSEDDLRSIQGRISEHSARAASELIERITKRASRLKEFPRSGRIVPEFGREDIREIIVGNYRVVYRVAGDTVGVAMVRHGARLLNISDLDDI